MRAKIREILEECIETGIENGYTLAHKYNDEPHDLHILGQIENAIWFEIDQRFDFERNVCDEVAEGFDHLGKKRSHKEFLQDLDDWAMSDKREWVGLTAEEVFSLVPRGDAWLAGAIEAKLKEKNT